MEIVVNKLGKQFQNEWIFRNFDFCFSTNKIYAITGPNGSGKSTLLQVLSGFLPQTSGEIDYKNKQTTILPDQFYQYITVATPYTELIEEFTAMELLKFHFKFKNLRQGKNLKNLLSDIYLPKTEDKIIKNFSSGMKQRLKLGLAFYSDAPVLLLDEPTSNLDNEGIRWFQEILSRERKTRTIIISSNQPYEYEQSDETIAILSYKTSKKPGSTD
jgi:ABC-type multidrug transport system ATPase subunit